MVLEAAPNADKGLSLVGVPEASGFASTVTSFCVDAIRVSSGSTKPEYEPVNTNSIVPYISC